MNLEAGQVQGTERQGPRSTYSARLAVRRARATRLEDQVRLARHARVTVFIPAAAILWVLVEKDASARAWLVLLIIGFLILLAIHLRLQQAWIRASQAVDFYTTALARLDERWRGTGEPGHRFLDPSHPYAPDLDLFGDGSLFELLCTVRTGLGERTLADWLLAPASASEIEARQAAVVELTPRLDLREDIALVAASLPSGIAFDSLAEWGQDALAAVARPMRWVVLLVVLVALASLVGWLGAWIGPWPVVAAIALEVGFALWLRPRVRQALADVDSRGRDLALLGGIMTRLEREHFAAPRLAELTSRLLDPGTRPSRQIARLGRLLDGLQWMRNPFIVPLGAFLLWGTRVGLAAEAWRARLGPALAGWLAVVGELEALAALATYADEHPANPFPDIVADGPCFDGQDLGHPLLPEGQCVRNDVQLGGDLRALVVSGSNMSGKSTLLRTVGINVVLALAGAPVRARRLRLSLLALGGTLRVEDSLQRGTSRFYAEILRIRQLVELARGPLPLFFLLDELFHGTNSQDRRLGAEGVVRSLIERGAVGLLTTHDLALTSLGHLLGPRVRNVHFEDQLRDGTLDFDYRMRPGVVPHSTALVLMRAAGLRV